MLLRGATFRTLSRLDKLKYFKYYELIFLSIFFKKYKYNRIIVNTTIIHVGLGGGAILGSRFFSFV
jgi:hypothetical protein